MKKSRLLSALLLLALLAGLLTTGASAEEAAEPADGGSGSAILDAMDVDATAAILVDPDSGEILYEKNAHEKRYPASITKVMTCLLTLEAVDRGELSLEQVVTASENIYTGIGENASTADIKVGEQVRIIDLLYAALIPSANEACNIMAEAVSGDVASFVELMNRRAGELGMEGTHFANAHGYHDDDHYTTAYDMYLITRAALENETFREIVGTSYYYAGEDQNGNPLHWNTTNYLITPGSTYYYEYATGVKTGTTDEAGRCLVSTAEHNGYHYMLVLMGAPIYDSNGETLEENMAFRQTIDLYDWAFGSFSYKTLIEQSVGVGEVPLQLAQGGKDYLLVQSGAAFTDLLPNEIEASSITLELDLPQVVNAPVQAGEEIGTIRLMLAGEEVGSVPAVAAESVDASLIATLIDRFKRLFRSFLAKFIVVFVVLCVVAYLTVTILRGHNRNKYYRRRR